MTPPDMTAVVTGAGSRRGIGRACALALGAVGWHLAVLDVDEDGAVATAAAVATTPGVQAVGLRADVTDAGSLDAALARLDAELPPVGALVNNAGIYSAAKAAQLGFARALARELGPTGVTVNAVAPGLIDTDITGDAFVGEAGDALRSTTPVGRFGRVEDVADVVAFLCRANAGYITGATYDVNGGSHIH